MVSITVGEQGKCAIGTLVKVRHILHPLDVDPRR
jgi:hypothetical protein